MFINPFEIIKQIDLKDNMLIADFGCGHGGFSVPLAKIVRKGRIFAIDIQKEALSFLEARKEAEKVLNIKTILSDIESLKGSKLGDSYIDLVVIANVLFQSSNRLMIMQEARRVIKNQGKILVVDWNQDSKISQTQSTISKSEIMDLASKTGLILEKELDAGSSHFALLFVKK
ncbi:class I SAM-dependent methyltransferase [Candidatus Parcubacteria bacterium]|nr:class I SAM-dependent methyltransferase [Candidatus Parcubacteria bacterium]